MDDDLKDLLNLQEFKELKELEEQLKANPNFSNELGKKFEKEGQQCKCYLDNNPNIQLEELKELVSLNQENLGNPSSQPFLSPQDKLLEINQKIIKLNNKFNECKKKNDFIEVE